MVAWLRRLFGFDLAQQLVEELQREIEFLKTENRELHQKIYQAVRLTEQRAQQVTASASQVNTKSWAAVQAELESRHKKPKPDPEADKKAEYWKKKIEESEQAGIS